MAEDLDDSMNREDQITSTSVVKQLHDLEDQLKAPRDSLARLLFTDDDWSLVIRGHALIEGAVTLVLSVVIDERLSKVFTRLELGQSDTGKLEFAKALDLLTEGQRRFIRTLSQLRNRLAHDPAYLGFNVADYVKSLDKQQLKVFSDAITFDVAGEPGLTNWKNLLAKNPRQALASKIVGLILSVHWQVLNADLEKARIRLRMNYADLAESMLESEEPPQQIPT